VNLRDSTADLSSGDGYLVTHPKVKQELDASDRHVELIKERFDRTALRF
jgi:hypothetical protein